MFLLKGVHHRAHCRTGGATRACVRMTCLDRVSCVNASANASRTAESSVWTCSVRTTRPLFSPCLLRTRLKAEHHIAYQRLKAEHHISYQMHSKHMLYCRALTTNSWRLLAAKTKTGTWQVPHVPKPLGFSPELLSTSLPLLGVSASPQCFKLHPGRCWQGQQSPLESISTTKRDSA